MVKRRSFHRDIKFSGKIELKEIGEIQSDIFNLRKQIDEKEKQIQAIRDECEHEFHFYCSGMYDDTYICKKCGEMHDV